MAIKTTTIEFDDDLVRAAQAVTCDTLRATAEHALRQTVTAAEDRSNASREHSRHDPRTPPSYRRGGRRGPGALDTAAVLTGFVIESSTRRRCTPFNSRGRRPAHQCAAHP